MKVKKMVLMGFKELRLFVFVIFAMLILSKFSFVYAFSGDGEGSYSNPFNITNVSQLQEMDNNLSSNYSIINNIDASPAFTWNDGAGFDPIGNTSNRFRGSLRGNDYNITHLYVNFTGGQAGLFGYIDSTAVFSGVRMINVSVKGTATELGGFAGRVKNLYLYNSSITDGNITNNDSYVGGFIGSAGGGYDEIIMDNLYFTGVVFATNNNAGRAVGGFVGNFGGYYDVGRLDNSYFVGNVTATRDVGGLVGTVGSGAELNMTNVTFTGNVTGYMDQQVGGLIGLSTGSRIINSSATGNIAGPQDDMGGLVGEMTNSLIDNSYFVGNVTSTLGYHIGGLVGHIYSSDVNNSYAIINVSGGDDDGIGGLVGYSDGSRIDRSYALGFVDGDSNDEVGGLVGYLDSSSALDNSYFIGTVISTGDGVGGLVGYNDDSSIDNSYALADVTGDSDVGGLVGYHYGDATMDHSYFVGNVTGDYDVGGLIGENYDGGFTNNSFAIANITADSEWGILIGDTDGDDLENSYWYSYRGGGQCTKSGNDTGCNLASSISYLYTVTNSPMSLWNFTSNWDDVCDGIGFPVLRFQNLSAASCNTLAEIVVESSSTEETTTTEETSAGGGYSPKKVVVGSEEIKQGTSNTFRVLEGYNFTAEAENHSLTVDKFNSTTAEVTVRSVVQKVKLLLGQEVILDSNMNGRNDVLLRYDGLVNGRAKIFIQELFEEEPENRIGLEGDVINEDLVNNGSNWLIWILILIVIGAIGAGYYYYKKNN